MSEHEIQKSIQDTLELQGYFILRVNCGRFQNAATGSWVIGAPSGTFDLLTHDIKTGAIIFLEVKTPTGYLSPEQIRFGREQHNRGRRWAVVTSVLEAEQAVRDPLYHGQDKFANKILHDDVFIPSQIKKTKNQRMSMSVMTEHRIWEKTKRDSSTL